MRKLVIYKSNTGFTKKYAEWIAQEASADILDFKKADLLTLNSYDVIIFGGSLHASGIKGVKFITKNLEQIKDKKIVVFATGATPSREETIKEIKNKNFKLEELKHIEFFYLRGGFDFSKLGIFDKILMFLLKWKIKTKKELTIDDKGMLAAYNNPVDFTNKENINEIITHVNIYNKVPKF